MSRYFVVIERTQIVEVEASTEEQAVNQVKQQLLAQDPRDTAQVSISKEITIQ